MHKRKKIANHLAVSVLNIYFKRFYNDNILYNNITVGKHFWRTEKIKNNNPSILAYILFSTRTTEYNVYCTQIRIYNTL